MWSNSPPEMPKHIHFPQITNDEKGRIFLIYQETQHHPQKSRLAFHQPLAFHLQCTEAALYVIYKMRCNLVTQSTLTARHVPTSSALEIKGSNEWEHPHQQISL